MEKEIMKDKKTDRRDIISQNGSTVGNPSILQSKMIIKDLVTEKSDDKKILGVIID